MNEMGIVYAHFTNINALIHSPRAVWHVEYPNGWARRSVMDYKGSVIYTRWIPPGRVM